MEILDPKDYEGVIQKYLGRVSHKINDMINRNQMRLEINLDDLRNFNANLCTSIILNPLKTIPIFEAQLNDTISERRVEKDKHMEKSDIETIQEYRVTFTGSFGRNMVSPRGLGAEMTNQLVCVQGIVTRMSIVRPNLLRSFHFNEETKLGSVKEYIDYYSLNPIKKNEEGVQYLSNSVPLKDSHGNPLSFEYGLSQFKDYQTVLLQEPPERTPIGQLPRSVECSLERDLVDKVKPGDRIQITGVFKTINQQNTLSSGMVRTILIATSVISMSKDLEEPKFSGEDIRAIREISKRKDFFELLGTSFSPSIHGHDKVKKGLILQLIGGVEKNLENGTHLRGDINVLLIGDPSTAKSQCLRNMMNIAPLCINTTGRGSSGVGLTAAVVMDKDTGERHLEAGAMVLADRGVVCIDEFDKMNDIDRVAIHEVMEQQTVTIAKAGIHVSLNARCSVLAAANPIYGEYQSSMPPAMNIGLPESLLSRFDLCFVVLDIKDEALDRKIAERVVSNHMYPAETPTLMNNIYDEKIIEPELNGEASHDAEIFVKERKTMSEGKRREVLTRPFLRKYLNY
jgi:DNA replication licensing factor MCM3